MSFSGLTYSLKENVVGLLGEGAKGYVGPPLKLLGGSGPPAPPPSFLRLWFEMKFDFEIEWALLRNFSVAISVSPHVSFILVSILVSMFLR